LHSPDAAAADLLHGGFALGLAERKAPLEAWRFGAAAAAIKCTRFGGIAGARAWLNATRPDAPDFTLEIEWFSS
jgi:sugar/nucleoside kinase (ribokinase family)